MVDTGLRYLNNSTPHGSCDLNFASMSTEVSLLATLVAALLILPTPAVSISPDDAVIMQYIVGCVQFSTLKFINIPFLHFSDPFFGER
jgi:hypothetical protein